MARPTNARGVRIVPAIENRPAGLREQFQENFLDRGEVLVKIEVLLFHIENERVHRVKKLQRPVALIAFRDEILAARIPVRVAPEDRNFRPDIMRRMQPAAAQNVRGHGRGRRLAVHPGDDDAALPAHDGGERFGATNGGDVAGERPGADRIVLLDR